MSIVWSNRSFSVSAVSQSKENTFKNRGRIPLVESDRQCAIMIFHRIKASTSWINIEQMRICRFHHFFLSKTDDPIIILNDCEHFVLFTAILNLF
jgi:hypothetical protein